MNRITAANLILVDINYLWEVGDGYLESIMELKTNINNIYSINLLSTLAVELLAKTIIAANICLENKDKEEKIMKLLKNSIVLVMAVLLIPIDAFALA